MYRAKNRLMLEHLQRLFLLRSGDDDHTQEFYF